MKTKMPSALRNLDGCFTILGITKPPIVRLDTYLGRWSPCFLNFRQSEFDCLNNFSVEIVKKNLLRPPSTEWATSIRLWTSSAFLISFRWIKVHFVLTIKNNFYRNLLTRQLQKPFKKVKLLDKKKTS